jgi:hypothetical protein
MFDTKEERNDGNGKRKDKEGDEGVKMIPESIMKKLDVAIKLAEKLDDSALKEKLEEVKKALAEEELKGEKKPEGDGKEMTDEKQKVLDEATKKVEAERDMLRAELDEIVKKEKTKLIDELGALQGVKTEKQLKEMSLDALKSDLELVKALKGGDKIAFSDMPGEEKSEIAKAYKGVGRQGGKE